MKEINSAANPNVKRLAKLHSRKGRAESDTFLVEGFSIVEEALSSPLKVKTLIIEDEHAESRAGGRLISLAERAGAEILVLSNSVFGKVSALDTPQGVAAEIFSPKPLHWKKKTPKGLNLLVEQLHDPRNMGLLARTALAAGVEAVYLTEDSVDPFHPFAVQASMGAVLRLTVYSGVEAEQAIKHFKANKGGVFATAPRGGISPAEWKARGVPALLILGNESRGVSPETQRMCDAVITIPISREAESLNVAVAAGVLCFYHRI